MAGTLIVAIAIDETFAKVRNGPPVDDARDVEWPVWADEVPLYLVRVHPEVALRLSVDRQE